MSILIPCDCLTNQGEVDLFRRDWLCGQLLLITSQLQNPIAGKTRSVISCLALESLCRSRSSFLAASGKVFLTKSQHFKAFCFLGGAVLFTYSPFLSFLSCLYMHDVSGSFTNINSRNEQLRKMYIRYMITFYSARNEQLK